jgi:hypothetical protein
MIQTSTLNDNQDHAYEDENPDDDDKDDVQIIPNPHTSNSQTHLRKRPNPFNRLRSSSPSFSPSQSPSSSTPFPSSQTTIRRSKRGQPFQAIYLADADETLLDKAYQPIENPEQGGRLRVRQSHHLPAMAPAATAAALAAAINQREVSYQQVGHPGSNKKSRLRY